MKNKNYLESSIVEPTRASLESGVSPAGTTTGTGLRAALGADMSALEWIASLSVCGGLGVLMLAFANYASRSLTPGAEVLFWFGLLVIFVPIVLRLATTAPSRNERLGLILVLAGALYFVKVMHSPIAFTFPDEFVHLHNLNRILSTGQLFSSNGILPATPYYPGLEIVASAISNLSGIDPFYAGIVLIGITRAVIVLALFLLFEQLSGSARIASLGVCLYVANPNYVFWSAQFSYESLALPLMLVALFALLYRDKITQPRVRDGLTIAALVIIVTVVMTHHLTTYWMVGFLWAVALLYWFRRKQERSDIWLMALVATLATVNWVLWEASSTVFYLAPVFRDALTGVLQVVEKPEAARQLFQSSTGQVSPLWERVVGIGSVLLILAVLPFGLAQAWRWFRTRPYAVLFAIFALVYPGLLALRFIRTGWEISNRASEFMFIGLAFILALGLTGMAMPERLPAWGSLRSRLMQVADLRLKPALVGAIISIIFLGGVIAGWPPNGRLGLPLQAQVGDATLAPEGVRAAEWALAYLGNDQRFAADYTNGRLLLSYGDQYSLTGSARGIPSLLVQDRMDTGIFKIIKDNRVQYILLDRRLRSSDPLAGIYFDSPETAADSGLMSSNTYIKYDNTPGVNRLFDSGDIFIYDVEALSGVYATK